MRIRTLLVTAAVLAPWTARAAEADPVAAVAPPADAAAKATGAVELPAATPATVPATPAAASPPEWRHAYQGAVGVGYYERIHVGVAWQPNPRSALGIFGGSNLSLGDTSTWDVGLSYAHALRQAAGKFELGWNTKALYWEQANSDYDWKMMSLVLGAYVARDVGTGLTLALDAGVSLNFSLDTVRKQNVNYEYPTRWNGSVCLELRYRFDRW